MLNKTLFMIPLLKVMMKCILVLFDTWLDYHTFTFTCHSSGIFFREIYYLQNNLQRSDELGTLPDWTWCLDDLFKVYLWLLVMLWIMLRVDQLHVKGLFLNMLDASRTWPLVNIWLLNMFPDSNEMFYIIAVCPRTYWQGLWGVMMEIVYNWRL